MKTLLVLLNLMNLACISMAQTPLELQDIHFVIIETNMSEVNELQKTLKTFRPFEIQLPMPENMDISKGYPTKPAYWYKPGKDEPSRLMPYYSPEDTLGKDVSFVPPIEFKLPSSGLSATVNSFDVHYCIVVRQFVNRAEAEEYINQLVITKIITEETNVFPIPIKEYDRDNLRFNFEDYLPPKPKKPGIQFNCPQCGKKHELNFEHKCPVSQSLEIIRNEDDNRVFRGKKYQYRVDDFIVFLGVIIIPTAYKKDLKIEAWFKCEMNELVSGNQQVKEGGVANIIVQLFDNLNPLFSQTKGLKCNARFDLNEHRKELPELTIITDSELKDYQTRELSKSDLTSLMKKQYH